MAKLPWWPFYGRDFFDDEHVKMMSNAQIGMYLKLLQHQWIEGSIPIEIGFCAFMDLRNQSYDCTVAEREFEQVMTWCFIPYPPQPGRIYNAKLEAIRQEQIRKGEVYQARARKGGKAASRALQVRLEPTIQSQSQSQKEKKKKKKMKSVSTRRQALEGFELTDEIQGWARQELGVVVPPDVFREFKHYWLDLPEKKLRSDWDATLKNRIRKLVADGILRTQPLSRVMPSKCAYTNEPCDTLAVTGSKYCQTHKDKYQRLHDRKGTVAVLVQDTQEDVSTLVNALSNRKSMVVN